MRSFSALGIIVLSVVVTAVGCTGDRPIARPDADLEQKAVVKEHTPSHMAITRRGVDNIAARSTEHSAFTKRRQATAIPNRKPLPVSATKPLPMSYRPQLRPGPFRIKGACDYQTDPSWPEFTMEHGETLNTFVMRASASSPRGLILNIPAGGVEDRVCQRARMKKRNRPDHVVVRGIPDEEGNLPRLYCRSSKRDGNIPNNKVVSTPFALSGSKTTVFDSLHIDGYKRSLYLNSGSQRAVIKSSYLHHAMEDGILWSNQKSPGSTLSVEICGSEVAHSGRGNVKHNIYGHRGLNGSQVKLTIVDSLFHSPNSSSNIKSIANTNVLVGNRILSQLDTDPSFKRRWASMNVDIASCAQNVIEDNEITYWRRHNIGKYNIGLRNRATAIKGCDVPPYDSDRFNDPEYWASTEDRFITRIQRNVFRAEPEETHGLRSTPEAVYAIRSWGTWPRQSVTLGKQGLLQPPTDKNGSLIWKERHVVVVDNNRYIGFDRNKIYSSATVGHCEQSRPGCWPIPSITPSQYYGKMDKRGRLDGYSYYEIGAGEVLEP